MLRVLTRWAVGIWAVIAFAAVGQFWLYRPQVHAAGPVATTAISTTEGGQIATFLLRPDLPPKDYGTTIYLTIHADGQSVLPSILYGHEDDTDFMTAYVAAHSGSGSFLEFDAYADGDDWYVREVILRGNTHEQRTAWQKGGYRVHVGAADDEQIEGTHTSTLTVGYGCDTELEKLPLHTIHATITNTITDNDQDGSINGHPVHANIARRCTHTQTEWEPRITETSAQPQSAAEQKVRKDEQSQAQQQEQLMYLLNESEGYASGRGETVWLKPDEGVRFLVLGDGAESGHSITVIAVDGDKVSLVIASDPIMATLQKDETKEFDVDGDGKQDISIKLVDIVDGQAGLEVRPLTDAARVVVVGSDSKKPELQDTAAKWPYVVGGVVVLGAVIGWLTYRGVTTRVWRALQLGSKKNTRKRIKRNKK